MECFLCNYKIDPKKEVDFDHTSYRCKECDRVFTFSTLIRREEGEVVCYERLSTEEKKTFFYNYPIINKKYLAGVIAILSFSWFLLHAADILYGDPLEIIKIIAAAVTSTFYFFRAPVPKIDRRIILNNNKITFEPIPRKFKKFFTLSFYTQNLHKIRIHNEEYTIGNDHYIDYDNFRVTFLFLNGKAVNLISMNKNLISIVDFLESLEKDLGIGRVVSHEYRTSNSDKYEW